MECYKIGKTNKEEVDQDFRHKQDFWDLQDIKADKMCKEEVGKILLYKLYKEDHKEEG